MGPLLFLIVSIWIATASSVSDNPGVKVRLTGHGFSYANKIGQHVLNAEIQKIKFPRIQVEIDGGPGHGQIEINKIKIASFSSPEYTYQLLPSNGIQWGSKNGMITLQADWAAWYKVLVKFTLDGTFSATAENIQILATVDLVRGDDGRLVVKVPNCKTTLGNVKVKISGGPIPSLINLFRGPIADAIQKAIEGQVCKQTQNVLINMVNQKIKTLPAKIPLFRQYLFDYTLTADPRVTADFMELGVNGSITYQGEPSLVEVPDMPKSTESDRMMYIWATDFVPNSLFSSGQNHSLFKYEISRTNTPQYEPFLRTSCPGSTCIGTYREQITQKFPNTHVIVDIWSSQTPKLTFGHDKSEIKIQLQATVYAEPRSNATFCISLQVDVTAKFLPYIIYGKVAGNASVENLDLQVLKSEVGEISDFEIWIMVDILKPKLQDAINARLGKGVPIPTTEGVQLVEPQIRMFDRAIQIETDVKYKDYDII